MYTGYRTEDSRNKKKICKQVLTKGNVTKKNLNIKKQIISQKWEAFQGGYKNDTMPDFIKACGLSHDSIRKPQRKEELESQVRNGFLHVVASAFGVEGAGSWVQDSKNPEQRPAFGVWIREAELCFLAPPLLAVREFLNLLETRLSSVSGDRAQGRVMVRSACVNTCDALSIFNQLWRKIVTRCEVGGRR